MLDFHLPTPLEYFAALVGDEDGQLPLLEAAAAIAQDEYPDLDVQQVLGEEADLGVHGSPPSTGPMPVVVSPASARPSRPAAARSYFGCR